MNMKGCLFLVTLLGTSTLMGGCSSLSLTGQNAPPQASNGGTSIGQASFASKMYSTIFLQPVPPPAKMSCFWRGITLRRLKLHISANT